MKKINLIFFILFFLKVAAQAEELLIAEVKTNIPLSDVDPLYTDYIIASDDSNSLSTLKKNLVVQVKRKISVKNTTAKDLGEIETVIGQLKIIHVDKKIAVGREYKLFSRENEVLLDYYGIMSGDIVDTKGSFMDAKPLKRVEREPSNKSETFMSPKNTPVILPEI